jgi:hypothetical protein
MAWALSHMSFRSGIYVESSGPIHCGNCAAYGSIRGVFVGYCGTCVNYYSRNGMWRGEVFGGLDVNILDDESIWRMYPYMYGVKKSEIGDESGADITEAGNVVNIEKLMGAVSAADECAEEEDSVDEEATDEDYISRIIRLRNEQLPIIQEADEEDSQHKHKQIIKRHLYNYYSNIIDKFGPSDEIIQLRDAQLQMIQEADDEDLKHEKEQAEKRSMYNYYTKLLRDILKL